MSSKTKLGWKDTVSFTVTGAGGQVWTSFPADQTREIFS